MYDAHRDAINDGLDDWSEYMFLHNVFAGAEGVSLNATDWIVEGDWWDSFYFIMYEVFSESRLAAVDERGRADALE